MPTDDMDTPTDPKLLGSADDEGEVVPKKDPALFEDAAAEPEAETPPADAVAEEGDPARDKQIPRARFDEVNAKLHEEREAKAAAEAIAAAAQAELAALKAGPPPDIKAMIKERNAALMSGEEDKAAELDMQIQAETEKRATERALAQADANALQREANRDYKQAYSQCLKDYPFLDAEAGNQEARAEVGEWRDFYIAKGEAPADALLKAAKRVAPAYTEAPADPANVSRIDPRKAAAIARNVKDAARQPAAASVAGAGNRAVPNLPAPKTQEEYEQLSDAERNKLLA